MEIESQHENRSLIFRILDKVPAQYRLPIFALASSCGLISLMMNSGFNDPTQVEQIIIKINSDPDNIPALIRDFNLEVPEEYLTLIEDSTNIIKLKLALDTNTDELVDSELLIVSENNSYPTFNLLRYSTTDFKLTLNEAAYANISGISIEIQRTIFENDECSLKHNLQIITDSTAAETRAYYEHLNSYMIETNDGTQEPIYINNINLDEQTPYVMQGNEGYPNIGLLSDSIVDPISDCIEVYNTES